MLIPEHLYRRMPKLWMLMGLMFLIFGLMAGTEFRFFPAYMGLGFLCICRSIWLYQARLRVNRRNEITVLTETQRLERPPQ